MLCRRNVHPYQQTAWVLDKVAFRFADGKIGWNEEVFQKVNEEEAISTLVAVYKDGDMPLAAQHEAYLGLVQAGAPAPSSRTMSFASGVRRPAHT